MTGFLQGVRYGINGQTGSSGPTERLQGVQWAGDRKGRPYGCVTRGAVRRADVGSGPYGAFNDRISQGGLPSARRPITLRTITVA